MHLKLAFSYDPSDLFRVTAVFADGHRHATEPIAAQYKGEKVFIELLLSAEIDKDTQARLMQAVDAAAHEQSKAARGEDVALTRRQLEILRLDSVLSQNS